MTGPVSHRPAAGAFPQAFPQELEQLVAARTAGLLETFRTLVENSPGTLARYEHYRNRPAIRR
ncbi:hypothetical protein LJR289_003677 [Pseudoduganella sp. LjRoot289]|uniref:hypothetical protein n=1 Tax=Pseudoduganella sp. LjRoot289 TaxID=3342314 RepID=UPI003ECEE773